ncbi:MAG TPA: glycoside hydrolase family 3 N-terminal domain-containing protein, partial [Gemmatimonadales bacterium]|nr:glycoside hydrolase family 3 N-terminal domain-containing protein [Gemmatimonadales bacterium]
MRLARLVIPALRWNADTGFAHELPRIEAALALGVGGFIIFGGPAQEIRYLTAELARVAGRPLLIGSDLERGAGQQVAGLSELPPPAALASLDDPRVARWAGELTAGEALSVGINWVFAPVADLDVVPENPIVQTRSFGDDPARVAGLVAAWVDGCESTGAIACAKHYPGHGRTTRDSHAELPVVEADAARLRSQDELPFRAAIDAGVGSVMTAHVAYPALDPLGRPATLSPPILSRLRHECGFEGLVVTDALIMEGARGAGDAPAAVRALRAGCDLLLYPPDPAETALALEHAVAAGDLPRPQVEASLARYERALGRAGAPRGGSPAPHARGPFEGPDALADALLGRDPLRGPPPSLRFPLEIVVVDDDVGGPFPPNPSDLVERELGDRAGTGGSRVVLAFAEPRGWKGRAGFGAESRRRLAAAAGADLVVLFGHPRLAAEIPGEAPVLVAWHRQALMQRAVARWLAAR